MTPDFDARLIYAIRNHIAPSVREVLRDADIMEIMSPMDSVNVPLAANVSVAYREGLAAFVISAAIQGVNGQDWLKGQSVFSSRKAVCAHDQAALIEHCFDEAKNAMLRSLASGELDKILGSREKSK